MGLTMTLKRMRFTLFECLRALKMSPSIVLLWLVLVPLKLFAAGEVEVSNPQVKLETEKGAIVIELFPAKAPISVNNFLKHVNDFHYDGLIFHRVIKGFMIQTGGFTFDFTARESERPRIVNEASNGLKNLRGTIAMARTSAPDSAQAQFFINHRSNSFLDSKGDKIGYAVFGKVISGMDTVDAIAVVPTSGFSMYQDVPIEPIRLLSARLLNPEVWVEPKDPEPAAATFERPIPIR